MVTFKLSQGEIEETFNYTLTRPMYPYGQCCKLIKSRTAEKSLIFKIVINIFINSETKVRSFKLLLSDKETSSRFKLHRFNVRGADLESSDRDGYNKFMIRLHQQNHLEKDRKFPCRSYKLGEYDRCLEEEYSRQFIEIINCTLPWVSDRQPLWCSNNLNVSASKLGKLNNLIDKILYGKADQGSCLSPCKMTSFEVEDIGFLSFQDLRGMAFAFADDVEVTTSELQITTKTLLTRVGGVIGAGKEFLWIILCGVSGIKLITTILIKSKKVKNEFNIGPV